MEFKVFENKIKNILFYCRTYGAHMIFGGEKPTESFDKDEFRRLCYDGYKIAQIKILTELKELQLNKRDTQIAIKQARNDKNKSLLDELNEFNKILDFQLNVFRSLADSLAWQILNGQHYFLRRLFTFDEGDKNLNDKSFEYVIDFANKINTDRDSFCLITDITSGIQLGDCLIIDKDGIKVSEIKSGNKNMEALEMIKEEQLTEDNVCLKADEIDKEFGKQIKRMLIQKGKVSRAAKIIQENEGPDPKFKDAQVKIIENDFEVQTFHSDISKLFEMLEHKDWAYDCIEGIVHVGVYKNDWRAHGQITMKSLCKDYPIYDLLSSLRMVISEPIFIKPFTEEQIIDIILGRVKIYIGIDYSKLIEFANHLGIKATWSTSKELHTFIDKKSYSSKEIFSFKNKGIKIEINDQQIFLGSGFFSKIYNDQILPSTMLLKYEELFANGINDSQR